MGHDHQQSSSSGALVGVVLIVAILGVLVVAGAGLFFVQASRVQVQRAMVAKERAVDGTGRERTSARLRKRAVRWGRYLTTQKVGHRGGADTATTGHAGRGRDLRAVQFILFAGRDFGKRLAIQGLDSSGRIAACQEERLPLATFTAARLPSEL